MRGIKVLKWMIYFFITLIVGLVVGNVIVGLINGEIWSYNGENLTILQGIESVSSTFAYCVILYYILKITKNAEAKNFFGYSNVKSFKYISLSVWYLTFLQIVMTWIKNGGINIGMPEIMAILVALFFHMLRYIFNEAYKLKESEKQLKEENKLII